VHFSARTVGILKDALLLLVIVTFPCATTCWITDLHPSGAFCCCVGSLGQLRWHRLPCFYSS